MTRKHYPTPNLIISSLDIYRLYNLMDDLPVGKFPGKGEFIDALAKARVLAPPEIPPDVVTMNSTVRYSVGTSKKVLEHTLVYPDRAADEDQQLSVFTPIGTSLLGLREGDEVHALSGNGRRVRLKVHGLVFQPERSGQFQV